GGEYVAVAGHPDPAIRVYRVAGLLAGGPAPAPQLLDGAGTTFRHVCFVRRGNSLGLALGERAGRKPGDPPRDPAPGDVLFDFAGRRLGDVTGWEKEIPDLKEWRASEALKGKLQAVTVTENGRAARTIALYPDHVLTDFAVLPPEGKRPPLLA